MTWLIEGRGSGEIDGAAFTDAAFRFTLKGRTESLRADRWTQVVDPLDSARIFIAGHGTAELRIPTRLGVAQSLVGDAPVVFLSRGGSMLDLFDFSIDRPVGLRGQAQGVQQRPHLGPVTGGRAQQRPQVPQRAVVVQPAHQRVLRHRQLRDQRMVLRRQRHPHMAPHRC